MTNKPIRKQMYILFAAIMMTAMLSLFAMAALTDTPNLRVTLNSQDPDPVQPGRYVELRFTVENLGTADVKNAIFELEPEFPFSLDPGDTPQRTVGSFYGKAIGNDGAILYYKLRVDAAAVEGSNVIKLKYSLDQGKTWTTLDEFEVRIQTRDPFLSVSEVKSEPERLTPGGIAKVTLTLDNMADSFIQDVTVKLDLSSSSMPFAPVNSISEKKAKLIRAGESFTFDFDIITLGDALSSIYKVPVTITYYDQSGNLIEKSNYISLVVGSEPDIIVQLESQDFYTSGASGDITIKFINKGVTDAKFMNVRLIPSSEFEIMGADTVYLGKLDSDDFETAEFKVYVKPTKESNVALPLRIDYADSNNQQYRQDLNLQLRMYSGDELKRFGMAGNGGFGFIFILILLAVAGFFIYKRVKKGKSKSK